MDYTYKILTELQTLENLSEEYKQELLFLSKRIRRDIWNSKNDRQLYAVMHAVNLVFKTLFEMTGYFDLSSIDEYIILLCKYGTLFAPELDASYKDCQKKSKSKKPPLPKGRGTTEGGGGIYG